MHASTIPRQVVMCGHRCTLHAFLVLKLLVTINVDSVDACMQVNVNVLDLARILIKRHARMHRYLYLPDRYRSIISAVRTNRTSTGPGLGCARTDPISRVRATCLTTSARDRCMHGHGRISGKRRSAHTKLVPSHLVLVVPIHRLQLRCASRHGAALEAAAPPRLSG